MRTTLAVVIGTVLVLATVVGFAQAQSDGPRFMLTGVVVTEGGGGRAWLQEPQFTQGQPVAVRAGETIGPYRLTRIFEDRVELEGPGGTIAVMLAGISAPVTTAVKPTPPPPPTTGPDRVGIVPPGPPLAPLPPGTPRVDFGSLLRGGAPSR